MKAADVATAALLVQARDDLAEFAAETANLALRPESTWSCAGMLLSAAHFDPYGYATCNEPIFFLAIDKVTGIELVDLLGPLIERRLREIGIEE